MTTTPHPPTTRPPADSVLTDAPHRHNQTMAQSTTTDKTRSRRLPSLRTFGLFLGLCTLATWLCMCSAPQICFPGTKSCRGALATVCLASGNGWSTTRCNADEQCKDGTCQPKPPPKQGCLPVGQTTCRDNSTLRTCQQDGTWKETPCQTHETCSLGRCVPPQGCFPAGKKECKDDKTSQVCQTDGLWKAQACAFDEECKQGTCTKKPGLKCKIDVQPTKLTFTKDDTQQVTVQNKGDGQCLLKRVALSSDANNAFSVKPGIAPNQGLYPNEKLVFSVTFQAPQVGSFQNTLLIESNDPDTPRVAVELQGDSKTAAPCQLIATPSNLDFGTLLPGTQKTLTFHIQNRGLFGSITCLIHSATLQPLPPAKPDSKAFQVKTSFQFPLVLDTNKKFPVEVSFQPDAQNLQYQAQLTFQLQDSSPVSFTFKGAVNSPCYTVTPSKLDFGKTKQGCSSGTQTITVRHTGGAGCPSALSITAATLSKGTSSPFSFAQSPSTPIQITTTTSAELVLSHKPGGLTQDTDTLQLSLSLGTTSQSVLVPLTGVGTPDNTQTDLFTQQGSLPVDVLFVIDDSCSMSDNQAYLAAQMSTFMNWAIRTKTDYHVGVTTTDVTGTRYGAGCLRGRGTPPYVTPATPNPVASLAARAKVGTSGSASEKGLEAMEKALSAPATTGCNQGFYRPNASLSVIFLSDENDQSPKTVTEYIAFLNKLKNNQRYLIRAHAIGPYLATSAQCSNGNCRYLEMTKAFGGLFDHHDAKWAGTIAQIGTVTFLTNFRSTFALTKTADPNTILVKVDSQSVPQDATNGWQYNKGAVTFAKPALPLPGSKIEITYQSFCNP